MTQLATRPSTKARSWRELGACLTLAVVVVAFCVPYFADLGRMCPQIDWVCHAAMHAQIRHCILHDGQFPFRSPLFGGGYPIVCYPESPQFNPLFIFSLLLGEGLGLRLMSTSHVVLAVVGTYALARQLGLARAASMFAALTLALSSWFPARLASGNVNEGSYGLLPLTLFCFERSKRRRSYFVATVLLWAWVLMDGKLSWLSMSLFWGVYALLRGVRVQAGGLAFCVGPLGRYAAVMAFVVGIGMVRIVPAADLLREIGGLTSPSLPTHLPLYGDHIDAYSLGGLVLGLGHHAAWRSDLCVGYVAAALALAAAFMAWRRAGVFVVLLILFAWLSMAHRVPVDLFRVLRLAPGFSAMTMPWKYFGFFVVLTVSLLAGCGLHHWIRAVRPKGRPALVAAVLLAGVVPAFYMHTRRFQFDIFTEPIPGAQPVAETYHVRGAGMTFTDHRPARANMYVNVLRGVGTLDYHLSVPLPTSVVPRFLVDAANTARPNPRYRGECYFVAGTGQARLLTNTANRIVIQAEVSRPGRLVLNQAYDRRWRSVEGKVEPYHGLLSAPLPSTGAHRIEFVYRPTTFYVGLALALLAALVLALWMWRQSAWPPNWLTGQLRGPVLWAGMGLCLVAVGCAWWWSMAGAERDSLFWSAEEALRHNRVREARELYATLVRTSPDHGFAQRRLGDCLLRLGRPAEAAKHLAEAAALLPSNVGARLDIADALWRQDRQAETLAAIREAEAMEPYDDMVQLVLAECLAGRGDVSGAAAALERALLYGYPHVEALRRSQRLRALQDDPRFAALLDQYAPLAKAARAARSASRGNTTTRGERYLPR